MFTLALLIGIYSYIIFAIGLSGFLYKDIVLAVTTGYSFLIFLWQRNAVGSVLKRVIEKIQKQKRIERRLRSDWLNVQNVFIALVIMQAFVNLIGALGPELGFDALWYHLTLSKLYLQNHAIVHIPGGLLYYSDMPKLVELIYVAALSFHNEILAKVVHYFFGIFTIAVLYSLSRKYFDRFIAIVIVTIFYTNLVVGWQSITAYVDLGRTFFELMALFGFLLWVETKERKWFFESAVMLGLAVTTKLLAVGSIVIFSFLIILTCIKQKKPLTQIVFLPFVYSLICLSIPLPWFIFSFVHTGNAVYPLFSSIYPATFDPSLLSPIKFIHDVWNVFIHADDPVLPIYLIIFPLVFLYWRRFGKPLRIIAIYSLLAFLILYVTPLTGRGRYLLPYLPAFSVVVGAVLGAMRDVRIYRFTICLILFLTCTSILYRAVANAKYIPVIIGKESKEKFLEKNLNFSFGDFYDTDGFFSQTIKKNQVVLLYGFHNLYYMNFPFVHESWVKKGNVFHYVAVYDAELPKRFVYWDLVYVNPITKVRLYTFDEAKWVY